MPLSLRDISHSYGKGRTVLHDVSIELAEGESVALMGPSGSGKTTLLSILGLLLTPREGEVLLDGIAVPPSSSGRARLRATRFGWVFQTANSLPRRTVIDNVLLGLLVRGRERSAAVLPAQRALEAVGIGHLAGREARELSGGELQRVCIARALAPEPSFVLADEPTGQLDHATTLEVVDALVRRRPSATSVIVATHDGEVARRCERILRVSDGRVTEERQ